MEGDLAQAQLHFSKCIALDPRTSIRPIVLAGLGGARMLGGDYGSAIAVLQESVQLRGSSPLSRVFLAACYGLMDRPVEARAALAASAAIAPVERFRFPFRNGEQRARFERGMQLAKAASAARE
jgi:predicted Zn-dependent protease